MGTRVEGAGVEEAGDMLGGERVGEGEGEGDADAEGEGDGEREREPERECERSSWIPSET